MTKSTEEYKKQLEEYKEQKKAWDNLNPIRRLIKSKPEGPTLSKVGDRYAIKYDDLGFKVAVEYEHPEQAGVTRDGNLIEGEQYHMKPNFWTIVEYIGDNKYKDVVTGKVFPIESSYGCPTITDGQGFKIAECINSIGKETLLENPLAIKAKDGIPELKELTPEIEKLVSTQTIERKNEIIDKLNKLEKYYEQEIDKYIELYNEVYFKMNGHNPDNNEKGIGKTI